jgi:hypothetical protein
MVKYYFRFEKRQVARLEMGVLLELFDAEQISNYALGEYFGAVQIGFGGYSRHDPHPMLDPELRLFLRGLGERWQPSAAAFFCQFDSPFLWLYFTAQLDHLIIREHPGTSDLVVFHRAEELAALQHMTLSGLEPLGRRAGLAAPVIMKKQEILSQLFSGLFRHQWQGK